LVLIAFFFYVSAYNFQTVTLGLLLMIGALALRIGIEIMSLKTINKFDFTKDTANFKKQMLAYYNRRRKVHFIITPIIIFAYCVGFVLLLPSFKASLSVGFYTYIIVSSLVLLIVLGAFIAKKIMKELSVLKELNSEH
ncbi:MAG: hypothetical protein WBM83_07310, partial [Flavobacteriaceae bacterium]